jgi:hypothetical protein
MEAAIRELMGAGTPPRFKFKDTYASIEFPSGYTIPAQATLEAKYDELLALEEGIQKTVMEGDLEVGTSNLFVDTQTGNIGIGTDSPAYTLDVHGSSNVGALTTTSVSGDGSGLTSLNAGNVSSGTLTRPISTTTGTFSGDVGIGTTGPTSKLDIKAGTSYINSKEFSDLKSNAVINFIGSADSGDVCSFGFLGQTADGNNPKVYIQNANSIFGSPQAEDLLLQPIGGNVGIGTASPDLELHVHDANNATSGIILSSTSGYHRFYEGSGQLYIQSGTAASADSRADIHFTSMYAGTSYMKIRGSNGNVGIGTTNPNQKLEVHGNILLGNNDVNSFIHGGASAAMSADTNILIVADSNDTSGAAPAGNIIFGSGSAVDTNQNRDFTYAQAYPSNVPRNEHMRITGDGNVGIGTTDPAGKLDVVASTEGDYIARFKNSSVASDEDARIVIEASDAAGESQILLQTTDESTTHKWNITTGSGLTPSLGFQYDSDFNGGTWAMNILHGGNVGIGLTSPAFTLDVNGVSRSRGVCVNSGFGNNTARPALSSGSTHPSYEIRSLGGNGNVGSTGADDGFLRLRAGGGTGTNSASYIDLSGYSTYSGGDMKRNIVFGTLGTERMRIKENGNVGIGTTSPDGRLHICSGTSGDCHLILHADTDNNNETDNPKIMFRQDAAIYTAEIGIDNSGNKLAIRGTSGIAFYDGGTSSTDINHLESTSTERMRIEAGGNVGIGTASPGYKLHVNGDIYATGNITGYSDKRAKSDIQKIENALDKIDKLNGYTFTMNDKRYTGVIAQEVLPVLPEAVTGSEETHYAVAYGNMMGLIIEAIKELKKKIEQ